MILWLSRCAHPVAPTGGPTDVTPPVVVGTDPPNYTTHFKAQKIEIDFNEFIKLKDVAKEIYTSPPMINKPEFTARGRTLVITLKEELRKDLTYVISFGSAIIDITESNPVKGFSYVFSTGAAIDSLSISGKILNAFDLKPVENILLSVYSERMDTIPLDSMPLKIPPLSAIRSKTDGTFQLTNLPGGEYLVFALEDLNSNFFYDLPNEKIAFLDSLVLPEYLEQRKDTTEGKDFQNITITQTGQPKNPITLYLFEKFDSTQRILSTSFTSTGSMLFAFRLPLDTFRILPLNFPDSLQWNMEEFTPARDTLILWPTDIERDTFELAINLGDTLIDTTTLVRTRQDKGNSKKKADDKTGIHYKTNLSAGILEPGRNLTLTFSEPLSYWDFSNLQLMGSEDTLVPEIEFADSIRRKLLLRSELKEDHSYRLVIPDSVFKALSGAMNDSILLTFKTRPVADYGTMIMNYLIPEGDTAYIAELINEQGIVVRRQILASSQKVTYRYLKPGTYTVKATLDRNHNGKWDPGNYFRHSQPEKVSYYPKDITIRANWELQEEWKIVD